MSSPVPIAPRAAIIPHHLVARSLMLDLASRLAKNPPGRLVIIGPNHNEVGPGHFITDDKSLPSSSQIIRFDATDTNLDHACYAPRSVLQKLLPTTIFSCVLISSRATPNELAQVSKTFSSILSPADFLVASVDFSHYLPKPEADSYDLVTQKYLDTFDTVSLLKLGTHYLDSPNTVTLLFYYLDQINVRQFSHISHQNSATILGLTGAPSTTSYFEIIYY